MMTLDTQKEGHHSSLPPLGPHFSHVFLQKPKPLSIHPFHILSSLEIKTPIFLYILSLVRGCCGYCEGPYFPVDAAPIRIHKQQQRAGVVVYCIVVLAHCQFF